MIDTHFREIAYQVKAGDIATPLLPPFDSSRRLGDAWSEWTVDLCYEHGLDPIDQIAIVVQSGVPVGWVDYFVFDSDKHEELLVDNMYPLTPDMIMSFDTPLLEAVLAFAGNSPPFFVILRGTQYFGWLTYSDLFKLPFQLCLFALLINLERMMLEICKSTPEKSLECLSTGRLDNAKKVYRIRGYHRVTRYRAVGPSSFHAYTQEQSESEFTSIKLLECTTLADKFTILRKLDAPRRALPSLKEKGLSSLAEPLRNQIAHPSGTANSSPLLPRAKVLPLLQWAEKFEREMASYLEKAENSAEC